MAEMTTAPTFLDLAAKINPVVKRDVFFRDTAGVNNILALDAVNERVGIGAIPSNASAILDITSTTKGILQPRMTTAQRDAISSPATGLMIYNTTTNKANFFNGTAWGEIGISTYLALTDTQGSFTANRIIHTNAAGNALTDSNVNILSTGELLVGATALIGSEISLFQKNQNTTTAIRVMNGTSGTAADSAIFVTQDLSGSQHSGVFTTTSVSFTPAAGLEEDQVIIYSSGAVNGLNLMAIDSAPIKFKINGNDVALFTTGFEFLVGATATVVGEIAGFTKNQNAGTFIFGQNTNTGSSAKVGLSLRSDAGFASVEATSTTNTGGPFNLASALVINAGGGFTGGMLFRVFQSAPIIFKTADIERTRILSTGEVQIGPAPGIASLFSVRLDQNSETRFIIENANTGNAAESVLILRAGARDATIEVSGNGLTESGVRKKNQMMINASTNMVNGILFNVPIAGAPIEFAMENVVRALFAGTTFNLVLGSGEGGTTLATGNIFRAPDLSGGTDIAGADLTIGAGEGRGIGDVGQIIFQTPRVQVSGSLAQTRATLMTLDEATVTIFGKLTVTGAIDPISLTLSGGGTAHFIELADGSTAALSGASVGRIRYNNSTGDVQVSTQAGAYKRFVTAGSSAFTAGSILFVDSDGVTITQDNSNLFFDDTNNLIGLGTATPDELFHVAKAVDGVFIGILIENSQVAAGGSTNETAELRFGFGGDNDVARIVAGKENDYTTAALSDSFLAFYTDLNGTAAERMRIDSTGAILLTGSNKKLGATDAGTVYLAPFVDAVTGIQVRKANGTTVVATFDTTNARVGIGTTTPGEALSVVGTDVSTSRFRIHRFENTTTGPEISVFHARGTEASPTAILSGDEIGRIRARSFDGTAEGSQTEISFNATENWAVGAHGADIRFETTANGSTSRIERVKIDQNGNVGIGTVVPAVKLEVEIGATDAVTGLLIDQNDIDQIAFQIDSEATTANVIDILSPATTTGIVFDVNADSLTTGKILNLISNSVTTNARVLVDIINDNTLATGAVPLRIQQDSTGDIFQAFDGTTKVFSIEDGGQVGIANGVGNSAQYRLDVGDASYFAINGSFAHIVQHNSAASTFWSIAPRNGGDLDIAVTTSDPRPTGATIGTSSNVVSIKTDKTMELVMGGSTGFSVIGGIADSQFTDVGNVGLGEDTLQTFTFPANAFNANGKAIRIRAIFRVAANTNVKTVKLHFGATVIASSGASDLLNNLTIYFDVTVVRTGASAQRSTAFRVEGTSVLLIRTTPAEDTTAAIVIKGTGETTTNVNNDVVQESMLVEFLN